MAALHPDLLLALVNKGVQVEVSGYFVAGFVGWDFFFLFRGWVFSLSRSVREFDILFYFI